MSWEHDRHMTLADGREVLVDYTVESCGSDPSGMSGPPENYDPGEGPEIYVTKISDPESGIEIKISDEERGRLEGVIIDNPDWWMPDYDGPDDDYRDYD